MTREYTTAIGYVQPCIHFCGVLIGLMVMYRIFYAETGYSRALFRVSR